jgi:DNA-binding response OmpR family regulator
MKILIVEDEEILRKVLQEKFAEEHFDVKTAVDGGAVVPLVKSWQPDLVLLDIILPKQDGLSVLQELKADADLRSIPVIITSNLGEDEKIKQALKLGAVDYLVKTQHPVQEIIDKVKHHLLQGK